MSRDAVQQHCSLCDVSIEGAGISVCVSCDAVLLDSISAQSDCTHQSSRDWLTQHQSAIHQYACLLKNHPLVSSELNQQAPISMQRSVINSVLFLSIACEKISTDDVIVALPTDAYSYDEGMLCYLAAAIIIKNTAIMSARGATRLFNQLQLAIKNIASKKNTTQITLKAANQFILIKAYISRLWMEGYYESALREFKKYYGCISRFITQENQLDFHGLNTETALIATGFSIVHFAMEKNGKNTPEFIVGQHGAGIVSMGVKRAFELFSLTYQVDPYNAGVLVLKECQDIFNEINHKAAMKTLISTLCEKERRWEFEAKRLVESFELRHTQFFEKTSDKINKILALADENMKRQQQIIERQLLKDHEESRITFIDNAISAQLRRQEFVEKNLTVEMNDFKKKMMCHLVMIREHEAVFNGLKMLVNEIIDAGVERSELKLFVKPSVVTKQITKKISLQLTDLNPKDFIAKEEAVREKEQRRLLQRHNQFLSELRESYLAVPSNVPKNSLSEADVASITNMLDYICNVVNFLQLLGFYPFIYCSLTYGSLLEKTEKPRDDGAEIFLSITVTLSTFVTAMRIARAHIEETTFYQEIANSLSAYFFLFRYGELSLACCFAMVWFAQLPLQKIHYFFKPNFLFTAFLVELFRVSLLSGFVLLCSPKDPHPDKFYRLFVAPGNNKENKENKVPENNAPQAGLLK